MKQVKSPQRTCVACRQKQAKASLLRFVKAKGQIQFDQKQVLPGRGAYICKSAECLSRAGHKNFLGRSLGVKSPELYDEEFNLVHLAQVKEDGLSATES